MHGMSLGAIPRETQPPGFAAIAVQSHRIVGEYQLAANLCQRSIRFEGRHRRHRPAGIQLDIAVDQGNVPPNSPFQTYVSRHSWSLRSLSQVFQLARKSLGHFGEDRRGVVSRGIVDDKDCHLVARPSLIRDCLQRARQFMCPVERRHNEEHEVSASHQRRTFSKLTIVSEWGGTRTARVVAGVNEAVSIRTSPVAP